MLAPYPHPYHLGPTVLRLRGGGRAARARLEELQRDPRDWPSSGQN